jgi:thiamine biosynthesis lipoprotein
VGYEKLLIDKENQTIRFQMDGMRIDLGGIAKGYGIDRAVEALTDRGAVGGLVDVGGDIFCFGMNRNGEKGWKIGIQEPVNPGGVLVVLNINQAAVATSGDYRRFVIIDGERYSHIVNPDTGTSATGTPSVTIISRTTIQADALATAVSVMGYQKGVRLLGTIEDTEAVILVPLEEGGLEKIYTEGMDKYIDTSYSEQ